jgi:hypothetical protein
VTADERRARTAQIIGSILAAILIIVVTVMLVTARLPQIQQRSPELHDAERDTQRDAERARKDAEDREPDD